MLCMKNNGMRLFLVISNKECWHLPGFDREN
jgi:hypothetical protein